MLHEWRSRIAATTSAINYLILSKAQEMVFSLKAYLSPNTYYYYNLMVNRISKYLKILDWDLKISWFRTLMLYFVVFPSIYSYYTFHKKKNFLIFYIRPMHWDDYILLMSDAWRLLFFVTTLFKRLHLWPLQWCQIKKCKCWEILINWLIN